MKKRTFLTIAIFTQLLGFSQTQMILEPFHGEVPMQPKIIDDTPCSQSNTDPSYIWFPAMSDNSQLIANDLFVEPNEIFALNQIIVALNALAPGIDTTDVIIWSDDGGLPDTILHSQFALIPSLQTLVGVDPSGGNVYETIIDLSNPIEMGGGNFGTTYWVQLYAHSSNSGVGWHATMENVEGYVIAVKPEGMGWLLETTNTDGTYIFSGECTTILGIKENISKQITIYPNPAKNSVHIQGHEKIEFIEVNLYDLSGQKIDTSLTNNTLDISGLSNGIYLLSITTIKGILTQKIIKQ